MASIRASETDLAKSQIVGSAWQASEPWCEKCVSKQFNMYILFCSKAWPRFHAPVVVSLHDVPEECCNEAHYTKLDADLFHNVFSAGISCECSYCRVSTVALCMSKNSIVYYDVITTLSLSSF